MNTTAATFTTADVARLAELIRPHLATCDGDLVAAAALAEQTERADFDRRLGLTSAMALRLMGTYDEFQALTGGAR